MLKLSGLQKKLLTLELLYLSMKNISFNFEKYPLISRVSKTFFSNGSCKEIKSYASPQQDY